MKLKVTLKAGHKYRSFECVVDDESNEEINWALESLMEQLQGEFMPDDYDYFTPSHTVSGINTYGWEENDE